MRPAQAAIATTVAVFVVALSMCQSATQITLVVVTDVDCADRPASLITVGDLRVIETKPGVASSERCDPSSSPHRVGTLIVTPSGAEDQEVALKVVEAIGQSAETCVAPAYEGCIVARRALRFIPHANVVVTVSALLACKNVPCGATQTCVRGNCKSATCDGANGGCNDPAFLDAPDGGGGGGGDGGDAAASIACKGTAGPPMVRLDVPNASYAFCIDTTEVTNEHFNAFLANPRTLSLPSECSAATVADLPSAVTDPVTLHRPRSMASFCDAWAYCAWAGKRLCGKIGGGRAVNDSTAKNEWVYACQNGTASMYPYGASYDPNTCNTSAEGGVDQFSLRDVASTPGCHGIGPGFAQVFDMSGNVAEMDSYTGATTVDDAGTVEVEARGGSVSDGARTSCGDFGNVGQYTRTASYVVGFRCCADVGR